MSMRRWMPSLDCSITIVGGLCLWLAIILGSLLFSHVGFPHFMLIGGAQAKPLNIFAFVEKWTVAFTLPVIAGTIVLLALDVIYRDSRWKGLVYVAYLTCWSILLVTMLLLLNLSILPEQFDKWRHGRSGFRSPQSPVTLPSGASGEPPRAGDWPPTGSATNRVAPHG